ncbi:MAG TPA: tetratricopeptide repeat protein [Candidatus Hydrogenedentes bacterium]|nr:tetratricopeptide repeat protein [Candidatus Hydrogenedentota bacterium]HOT49378.1 tetratricopeptide repeat protein [Candidatus Hydrogenedentota bacterium]
MDPNEAVELYRRAERLFMEGRFKDALSIVERLDAAFPKTKPFMFSRAKCLQKLNRIYEAAVLCDVITAQFQDPRAAELKRSLLTLMPAEKGMDTGSPEPSEIQKGKGSFLWIGAAVAACIALALGIALFLLWRTP